MQSTFYQSHSLLLTYARDLLAKPYQRLSHNLKINNLNKSTTHFNVEEKERERERERESERERERKREREKNKNKDTKVDKNI